MSNFEYEIDGGHSGVGFLVDDRYGRLALQIHPWADHEECSWSSNASEVRELIAKLQEALAILESAAS